MRYRYLFLILIVLFCCQSAHADTVDGIESESFEVTQWDGLSAPSVSPSNSGRIYYDSTLDYMLSSENGGAYARLLNALSGSGLYWLQATDQTGLTGDKSGTFDLFTLGNIRSGSIYIGSSLPSPGNEIPPGYPSKSLNIYRIEGALMDYMKLYINGLHQFIWSGYADMIIGPTTQGSSATGKTMTVVGGTGGMTNPGAGGDTYLLGGAAGGGGDMNGGTVHIHGGTPTGAGVIGDTIITGPVNFSGITGNVDLGSNNLVTTGTLGTGAATVTTINTGSGTMEIGDAAVANGDTDSVPTGDQVYDFVSGSYAPIASPTFTGTATMPHDTNQPGARHQWHISIVNPNAVVTASTIIPIVTLTDAALTITKIEVSTDNAGREAAGDLKFADARIGLANATVVETFDTASGIRSDSSMSGDATIPSGKFVYLSFDSAPSASMTDMVIDIWWDYD